MPRKVRITTTSFNPSGQRNAELIREQACSYVEAAGAEGADLVCLPEDFLHTAISGDQVPYAEPLPGPTFDALSLLAHRYRLWIVAGYCVCTGAGLIENSAVVIDRQGNLAGRYAKVYPTIGECERSQITPGLDATVVDTDFGRMGLAICFDIGWPEHWAALQEQGAEFVVWPSAYDGGLPLHAYAWTHSYYVITAVRSEHSKVIDVSGRVLASTSKWHRLASTTIDLEKEVFHIDQQVDKLFRVQRDLGQRVSVQALSEENVFTIESNDPDWPVARLKQHYELENFRDYHDRSTRVQERHRNRAAAARLAATISNGQ